MATASEAQPINTQQSSETPAKSSRTNLYLFSSIVFLLILFSFSILIALRALVIHRRRTNAVAQLATTFPEHHRRHKRLGIRPILHDIYLSSLANSNAEWDTVSAPMSAQYVNGSVNPSVQDEKDQDTSDCRPSGRRKQIADALGIGFSSSHRHRRNRSYDGDTASVKEQDPPSSEKTLQVAFLISLPHSRRQASGDSLPPLELGIAWPSTRDTES